MRLSRRNRSPWAAVTVTVVRTLSLRSCMYKTLCVPTPARTNRSQTTGGSKCPCLLLVWREPLHWRESVEELGVSCPALFAPLWAEQALARQGRFTLLTFGFLLQKWYYWFFGIWRSKNFLLHMEAEDTPAKWWACSIPADRSGFLNNTLSFLTDTRADRLYCLRITHEEVYFTIIQMDRVKVKCYCFTFKRESLGTYHSRDDFFLFI